MRTTGRSCLAVLLAGTALVGCSRKDSVTKVDVGTGNVIRIGADSASDSAWTPLLDSAITQWREYKTPSGQKGWTFKDGVMSKTGNASDLQSVKEYGNFELTWDWMLEPGGNAGVFYRVTEEYNKPYWSGPEYQLLDDARHPDGKDSTRTAASAYAIYAPSAKVVKPGGEWNSSRLIVNGTHVEHWLNGTKVVDYELKGADWAAKVKASKFAKYPNYGLASRGYISIQGDHEGQLSIRAMRIRELP